MQEKQQFEEALHNLLRGSLVTLHLRVTTLLGYISMVVWIVYIGAPRYCSSVNKLSFNVFIGTFVGFMLGTSALHHMKRLNAEQKGRWDHGKKPQKVDAAHKIDSVFKLLYLAFTLGTYYSMTVFYSTVPSDYASGLAKDIAASSSGPVDPRLVTQLNVDCERLCSDFVALSKNAWLTAIAIVTVVWFVVAASWDYHSTNFTDSLLGGWWLKAISSHDEEDDRQRPSQHRLSCLPTQFFHDDGTHGGGSTSDGHSRPQSMVVAQSGNLV